ncbi:histidine kinase [Paramagnetospirillum marisnigri]|uniref:histidine kinase n=1 Tax=Paramagnetospirillum marisnigri TaxID=1285242 RepID=A0A178M7I8_9PROT|nr:histidine kinase [Paramagnetospirillum marisnigri]
MAAVVTALASLALIEVYRLQVERRAETARAEVVERLGGLRARLESALTEPLLVTRGLQADLVEHGDMSDEEFSRLAAVLLADYPAIRNLTLARGTVIAAVYPEAGNRAALGVDYRSRPDQWGTVERAIKTRRPVLAGPVTLVQGGVALIGRVPVYLPRADKTESDFFGLISVVIDVPVAFATAGVDQETLPIRLAIRGRDGLGAAGGMIWGDEAIFSDSPIEMDVMLPGGSWQLAALPKGGWDADHAELQVTRLLGIILALIVGLASFGTAFYIRSLRSARWRAAESEERYRALVETSPMAVCVHRDGVIIFANEAAVRMAAARSAEDFVGVNIFEQVHPDFRPQALSRVQALMSDGGALPSMETRLLTLDGRGIDVEIVSARVTMDGRPAVLSLINDITLRHQAEAERESLVQNLRRSNEDLLQFAYIASHDLQEPLRNVSGYVQLLGRRYRGKLDKDADQFIDFAVDGVKRMQEMISSLLDYSRLNSEMDARRPIESDAVLERVLSDMSAAIARQGGRVEARGLPRVLAHESELARIFQNLIGNGLKYARSGVPPVIAISARRSGPEWTISVADNGIGISEEYHDRIFTMFQRLHARDAYGGTGIGLAICRKLVQHNGGRIWVESREGEGSTFHFTLPAA